MSTSASVRSARAWAEPAAGIIGLDDSTFGGHRARARVRARRAPAGSGSDDELAEMRELARTAGVEPVGAVVQHRGRPAQRTYVGKGKLEELKDRFGAADAESLL